MKTNGIEGRILKETGKAICVEGEWIPKSAVAYRCAVIADVDPDGWVVPCRRGRELVLFKYPLEVSGDSSGVYVVETADNRYFEKRGFSGWHEIHPEIQPPKK